MNKIILYTVIWGGVLSPLFAGDSLEEYKRLSSEVSKVVRVLDKQREEKNRLFKRALIDWRRVKSMKVVTSWEDVALDLASRQVSNQEKLFWKAWQAQVYSDLNRFGIGSSTTKYSPYYNQAPITPFLPESPKTKSYHQYLKEEITAITETKSCDNCGGDGLEDSGTRIGLPRSEWKDAQTCPFCKGTGKVERTRE